MDRGRDYFAISCSCFLVTDVIVAGGLARYFRLLRVKSIGAKSSGSIAYSIVLNRTVSCYRSGRRCLNKRSRKRVQFYMSSSGEVAKLDTELVGLPQEHEKTLGLVGQWPIS